MREENILVVLIRSFVIMMGIFFNFSYHQQAEQTIALQQIATELAPLQVVGATLDDAAKPRGKR